jgi:hypothetical protein
MTTRPGGVDRLLGEGRFRLEQLIAATLSSPGARQELRQQRVARLQGDRAAEQRRVAEALSVKQEEKRGKAF